MTRTACVLMPEMHSSRRTFWRNILLAFALACSRLSAQTVSNEEAQIAFAIRNGDYSQALHLLGPALRNSPDNAQLWTMQGVVSDREGNQKDALAAFEHALKIAPNTIPALQGAVQIRFDAGDQRAIPLLQRLLRLRPEDTTSHAMLAVLEYQRGDCGKALPHFQRGVERLQSQPDALHAYAICLVKVKQPAEAVRVLKRTAELKQGDPRELRPLASAELMAQQPAEALAALQPLLEAGLPDADVLELASSAYEGVHDTDKAVDALRRAILLQPNNSNLYVEFATLSMAHQSLQVGINVVTDGLALQPQSAPLYFARGMLYAQQNKYEQAQADFETAYRLEPNQSLTSAAQAMLAGDQSNLDGSLKTIEQKLAQNPNDAVLLYLRADILTQQGAENGSDKFKNALLSAKRSLQLKPSVAAAHAVLGRLYLQSGDYPNAIIQCRQALQLNPKDEATLYRLIQALRKTDHKNELPDLLKQLAQLHEEATVEQTERERYRIVEGGAPTP